MAHIDSQLERAQLENLTTAQEPAQGTTGRVWLNTDTGNARVDDGTVIKDVGTAAVPTGAVMDWSASSAPAGWLLCDGGLYLKTSFPALNSLYLADGYPYGSNATHFNTPDLRGRVVAGKDDMGGGAANRITVAESGITGTNLGASGGAESHQLVEAEIPGHTHSVTTNGNTNNTGSHTHGPAIPPDFLTNGGGIGANITTDGGAYTTQSATASAGAHQHSVASTGTAASTGGDTTHQNTQPTLIMNKIVKA